MSNKKAVISNADVEKTRQLLVKMYGHTGAYGKDHPVQEHQKEYARRTKKDKGMCVILGGKRKSRRRRKTRRGRKKRSGKKRKSKKNRK